MAVAAQIVAQFKSEGANAVKSDIEGVGDAVDGTTSKSRALGNAFLGLGTALILPMQQGLMMAIDMEQAMADLNASLGGIDASTLKEIEQGFLDIGAASKFSAVEVAAVGDEIARAGFPIDDIIGMTQAVVDLSQATGAGLMTSVSGITSAMQTWSPEIVDADIALTDAARAADIFTVAANASSAEVDDIIAGLRNFGPTAASIGIGFDEASAAIAMFTNYNIKAADSGVSLTRAIQNLQDPTAEAQELMNQLGITVFDMHGEFVGLPVLFDQLHASMKDMTPEARNMALTTLFGAEALDVMTVAVLTGGDPLRMIQGEMEATGIAAEQSALRMDTLGAQFGELVESVMGFLASLVSGLIPGMRFFVDLANDTVDVLNRIPQSIKTVIGAVAGLAAGFAAINVALQASRGASALLGIQWAGVGAALTGILPVIALVAAAVGGLYLAWRSDFMGIRTVTKDVFGRVTDTVEGAIDAFQDMWDSFGDGEWVLQDVTGAFGTFQRAVWIAGDATNTLSRFLFSMSAALASIGGDNTPAWIAAMARGFRDLAVIVEEIVGHFGDLRERGLDPVQAALVAVGLTFEPLYNTMLQAAAVVRDLTGAFNAFIDGDFDQGFNLLGNAAETAWGIIRQGLSLAGELAQSFGNWVLDVGVPTVTGWILDFAADAWGAIKTAAGIAFEVAADIGAWVLDTAIPTITGWAVDFATDAWNAIKTAAGIAAEVAGDLGSWVLDTAVPSVTGWVTDFAADAWGALKTAANVVGEVAADIATWVLDTAIPTVTGWLEDFKANAWDALKSAAGIAGEIAAPLDEWILEVGAPTVDLDTSAIEGALDRAIRAWEIAAAYDARITEWKAILAEPSDVDTSEVDDPSLFQRFIDYIQYEVTSEVDWLLDLGEAQIEDEDSAFNKAGNAVTVMTGAWDMLKGGPVNWEIILGSPRLGGMGLLPAFLWMQANIIQPIQDKWDELTGLLEWIFPDIDISWPSFSLSIDDVPFYTEIKSVIDQIIDWFASPWGDSPLSIPAPDIDWPSPPEIPEWLKDPMGWLQGQITWPGNGAGENNPYSEDADLPNHSGSNSGKMFAGDWSQFPGMGGGIAGGGAALGGGLSNAFAALQRAVAAGMESVRSTISTKAAEWGTALQSGTANISSIASAAFAGLQAVATPPLVATGAVVAQQTALMMTSTATNLGAMVASAATQFPAMQMAGTVATSAMNVGVTASMNAMRAGATAAATAMQSGVTSSTNTMRSTTTSAVAGMQAGIALSMLAMQSSAISSANSMRSAVVSAMQSMASGAANAVRSGMGAIPGIISGIGGAAAGVARAVGANIGNAMAAGMMSALGAIRGAANAMVAEAQRALTARAMIASPSKLFMGYGENIGEGFAIGIERMYDEAARATRGLIDTAAIGSSAFGYANTAPYAAGGNSSITINDNTTYHITQRPGEDMEALARRLAEMRKRDLESVVGTVSIGGSR